MVKPKKVTEPIRINGYDAYINLAHAEFLDVLMCMNNIREVIDEKYLSVMFENTSDPWDDCHSDGYILIGTRWETDEEVEARVAKEKAAKKAQKESILDKERKEYERLKKKFEK